MKVLAIFALVALHAIAADWDQRYTEVCAVDSMCTRLKNNDGTWLHPKSEVMALMRQPDIQNEIKSAAQKNGINPVALAGVIAAENSLNVGVKDGIENFLASKMGVTSIAGKKFTFGLGQINIDTAMAAEAHSAQIENRQPRSKDQIRDEISDPLGSIRMAAEVLRQAQDDYKAQGIDISNNVGALATLYNLGKTERHAAETKKSGKVPQDNYFGLFVEKYSGDISSAAKINQPVKTVAAAIPVVITPAATVTPSTLKAAEKKTTADGSSDRALKSASAKNLVMEQVVSQSMTLTAAPTTCKETSSYGQNVEHDVKALDFGHPTGIAEKGSPIVEVSRALDCNMNPWSLVNAGGKVGWVADDTLAKSTEKRLGQKPSCASKSGAKCEASMADKIKDYKIEDKSSTQVYLKPIAAGDSKAGFKKEDFICYDPKKAAADAAAVAAAANGTQAGHYSNATGFQANGLTEQQKEAYKKAAEEFLKVMNKEFKKMSSATGVPIGQLGTAANPYGSIYNLMAGADSETAQKCLTSLRTELYQCSGFNLDRLKAMIQVMKDQGGYKSKPTLAEIVSAEGKIQATYQSARPPTLPAILTTRYTPMPDEIKNITPAEIRKSISDCVEKVAAFENKYAKSRPAAQNQTTTSTTIPSGSVGNPYYGYGVGYYSGSGTSTTFPLELSMQQTNTFLNRLKTSADDVVQNHAVELVTFAKFCHARANLVGSTSEKNSINCTQFPEIAMVQMHYISRDVLLATYKDQPELLAQEIYFGISSYSGLAYMDMLNRQMPSKAIPVQQQAMPVQSGPPSFCPNKTSEYIEDLIKSNPCISHVYVPSNWISKKLSSYGDKVIYRDFDEGDRYMIEFGDSSCRK